MIDAVITYVDASDKTWVAQYNKFVKAPLEEKINRYRSYNVLDLQIKCIRKFMPFVSKIFIIVSSLSQVPENIKNLKNVFIVTHEEIIQKIYLPCFNSCTIEMFMNNISKLSEKYLYFNDDVFPIKECKERDFFIDDKICMNYEINTYNEETCSVFQHNLINSTKTLYRKNEIKFNAVKPVHSIMPMFKNKCKETYIECYDKIVGSLTRTRHRKNINAYIFLNYMFKNNKYENSNLKYECIELGDNISKISKDTQILCVNDNNVYSNFENNIKELKQWLECRIDGKEYKEIKKASIKLTDKLYVSFTSWTKRIQYCKHTVDLMMRQTLKPTKIILNLAEEEFPNKENDLPKDLLKEAKENKLFEIYWVKENTNVWKKIIPTMKRFPDDLVLSIDDDIEYPSNYIEEMYKTFVENKKLYPVVAYRNFQNNRLYHSGPFTLTNYHFYGKYLDIIYDKLIYPSLKTNRWSSDNIYSEALFLNHNSYIKCNTIDANNLYISSEKNKENAYSKYESDEFKQTYKRNLKQISSFINSNFEKPSLDNIKLIVSFTTWKKRDKYVEEMLTWFQRQTFKPYKIICWIAYDEYNGVIPETLQKCLEKHLLSEIRWTDLNIYGHKRYEIFKEYSDCYVATIDDDLYYPVNHLQNLLETSLEYNGCICSYFSRTVNYENGYRKIINFENPNIKNEIYSGLSLYPPHTFPVESFKYEDLRNKYCIKCDDSWINAWLKKYDIPVAAYEEWHNNCLNPIDGTTEDCIWNTHNNIKVNGEIIQLYYNRMTSMKVIGIENIANKLWPKCNIDKYNNLVK